MPCCILVLAAAIFSIPNCFAQNTLLSPQSKFQKRSINYFPDDVIKSNVNKESIYDLAIDEPGNQASNIEAAINGARLDSIYELKNLGYYNELYHWKYHYNTQLQADTMWRFYFSDKGEFKNITEISSYNAAGQLLRFVTRQRDVYSSDSAIKEMNVVEYKYQDGNLIQKTIDHVNNTYYTYDEENKLIHLRAEFINNATIDSEYYYNPDDKLEYILTKGSYFYGTESDTIYQCSVNKYEYEMTDSTKNIFRKKVYYYVRNLLPDTISQWDEGDRFYEAYDKKGRKTFVIHMMDQYNPDTAVMDYKAEFIWTETNKLLHASYFRWQGTIDTGIWNETMRIDNTYDGAGNLFKYDKTFYNTGLGHWDTEQNKTYYYTSVPVGLTENTTKSTPLSIYPNPAQNEIYVSFLYGGTSRYTIYNLYGQLMLNGRLENKAITVSQLKPGIYIIEIFGGQSIYSGKFVKY